MTNKGRTGADADRGATGQAYLFQRQRAVVVVGQVGTYFNRSMNAATR